MSQKKFGNGPERKPLHQNFMDWYKTFCFDLEFCFKNEYIRSFLEQKNQNESFRSWKNVGLTLLHINQPPEPAVSVLRKSCCYYICRRVWAPAQERRYWCEHKRGNYMQGVWRLLDEQKARGRREMVITGANAASWISSCSAPSQAPSLWKITLWLLADICSRTNVIFIL